MTDAVAPGHPPIVDLGDFDVRKPAITAELMTAATTTGARVGASTLCRRHPNLDLGGNKEDPGMMGFLRERGRC